MVISIENKNKRFILERSTHELYLESEPNFKDAVLAILGLTNENNAHLPKERMKLARTRIVTLYSAMKNQPALRGVYIDQIKNVIINELKIKNGKKIGD